MGRHYKRAQFMNRNPMTRKIYSLINEQYGGIALRLAEALGVSKQHLCWVLSNLNYLPLGLEKKLNDLYKTEEFTYYSKRQVRKRSIKCYYANHLKSLTNKEKYVTTNKDKLVDILS